MISQIPETFSRRSRYAAEGTVAHQLCEDRLKMLLGLQLNDWNFFLGAKVEQDGFDFKVDQQMLDSVTVYTDLVMGLVKEYDLSVSDVMIEKHIVIPDTVVEGEMFGTPDTIIHVPYDMVIVIDFKYGAGHKVEVEGNKQLLFYALGAYYALTDDQRSEISKVRFYVVQPRVPGGGVQYWDFPVETLLEFHVGLIQAATRCVPGAELKAGDWCRWCPAKASCPAMVEEIYKQTAIDFADVNLPAKIEPTALPSPLAMTPQQVAVVLDNREMIKKWLKSFDDYALGLLDSGVDVPGYKKVKKKANRAWIDKNETAVKLDRLLGDDAFEPKEVRSPAQMEKAAKKLGGKEGAQALELIKDLVHVPDKGTTLAPESDRREGLPPAVVLDLDGVVDAVFDDE